MFNPYSELGGNFINRTFADVFPTMKDFVQEYETSGLYSNTNKVDDAGTLYYLLYAKYGNSTIASFDENQFKYKVFSTIFTYGPTWEAKLKTQHELRELINNPAKQQELFIGAQAVYNHSYNPSSEPTTVDFDPLNTVNDQTANRHTRGKLDAYATLMAVLNTDITEEFIGRFKKLFITIVQPNLPLWYESEKEN